MLRLIQAKRGRGGCACSDDAYDGCRCVDEHWGRGSDHLGSGIDHVDDCGQAPRGGCSRGSRTKLDGRS